MYFGNARIQAAVALVGSLTMGTAYAAATDSVNVVDGNVGVGTDTPSGALHVLRINGEKPALVLESQGGATPTQWEIKSNPATGRLTFKDLNGTTTPFKFQPTAAENLFRVGIVNNNTVDINGNLVVTGNCTEQDGACADYVFEPNYELRSLESVQEHIQEHGHLPNIPSAAEMKENGVNMAHMSGRLLEKIEELTLYAIDQKNTIDELKNILVLQNSLIEEQKVRLDELENKIE